MMTTDEILILGFIAFGLIFIFAFAYGFYDLKKNKEKYDAYAEEIRKKEDEEFEREPETKSFHAEIVDMVCGTGLVGSYRLPKSQKTFLIVFKSDDGEITELAVPETFYLELEVGDKGMLTICEGNLDSFEPD